MAAGIIVAVTTALVLVQAWQFRRGLAKADDSLKRGDTARALEQLQSLRPAFAFGRREEYEYDLAVALWAKGRRPEALAIFERLPWPGEHARRAAFFRAEAALLAGRLDEVEGLIQAVRDYEPQSLAASQWLEKLYRMQARFDEVRRILVERLLLDPSSTVATLRALWVLDRGIVPLESIEQGIDQAARLAPEDYGVQLGLARLAILAGRLDEAERRLGALLGAMPDRSAGWHARLDLAMAADRPADAARAIPRIEPLELLYNDAHRWLAWLHRRATATARDGPSTDPGRPGLKAAEAERRVLLAWLEIEPRQVEVLERLAELAALRGDPAEARRLRQLKAETDDALLAYDQQMRSDSPFATAAEQLRMAKLAEAAGRPIDAAAWLQLAASSAARDPEIGALTQRIGRLERVVRGELASPAPLVAKWEDVLSRFAARPATWSAPASGVAFRDESVAAGLDFTFQSGRSTIHQMPEALGGGVGLIDYDNDGWLDIYLPQGGPFPPPPGAPGHDRLFRNRNDGTFQDVSEAAGIARLPGDYGFGVAVGDYDNDGNADLFLTRWNAYRLLRNRGDGTFEDTTGAASLGGDRGWPTSAAFADLDADGDLDLYVCHYLKWDAANPRLCRNPRNNAYMSCSPRDFPAESDRLFLNRGDGTFEDATDSSGLAQADTDGRGLGVVAASLEGMGTFDPKRVEQRSVSLFVADDQTANLLLRPDSSRPLRLSDLAPEVGLAGNAEGGYRAGMGVACGDLDGDGLPELAVTNFYGEGTTLYRNLGGGLFADESAAFDLAAASRYLLGFGIAIADFDNDGRNDLLTANGHLDELPDTPFRMPMQLMQGTSDGRLHDATPGAGEALTKPRLARGLAVGDLDNDGRLDAVVVDQDAPVGLLMNRTEQSGHWIALQLEGSTSHRDAVGAVVAVGVGQSLSVTRRIGGGSYLSASDPRLHVGLGEIDSREVPVMVAWPSGTNELFTAPIDTGSLLREGTGVAMPLAGFESSR